jgi:hypothetical protein
MSRPPTAFLDASVIYPAGVRNLLMYLHLVGAYRRTWSDAVHTEWIEALLRRRPDLGRAQLERTRDLMNRHAVGAAVSGYEARIAGIVLPDADDRHVVAAAVHGGAGVIVTTNLRDFPESALAPLGIEALHPDDFVLRLFQRTPALVVDAARQHRQSLKAPPQAVDGYLDSLEVLGLTGTVAALRPFASLLA